MTEDPDDLDDLVPLRRKRAFHADLDGAVTNAIENREPVALIMIDGDGFKQVNDQYGHPVGDEVLKDLGELIRRRCKGKGQGYRFGGDEFGVLVENCGPGEAAGLAEDLRREVEAAALSPKKLHLTVTLGVACIPDHALSAPDLLKRADEALYQAKQLGRNRVCPADTSEASPRGRVLASNISTSEQVVDYDSLIVLHSPDGNLHFVSAHQVQADETLLRLSLAPEDNRQSSVLSALPRDRPIGIAYGLAATYARQESATKTWEKGRERWDIVLREHSADYGDSFVQDMAVGGLSADDLATMRARRILLNEGGEDRIDASLDGLNNALLEMYVRGFNTPIEVERSPFLSLRPMLDKSPQGFLAAARLVGVLFLRLSGAVKHVWRLDLQLVESTRLGVHFEGQRERKYQNQEPAVIRVEGICDLEAEVERV